eukprot:scaffold3300_cov269-Prasinococcus_capsulatus_cf.AAC.1
MCRPITSNEIAFLARLLVWLSVRLNGLFGTRRGGGPRPPTHCARRRPSVSCARATARRGGAQRRERARRRGAAAELPGAPPARACPLVGCALRRRSARLRVRAVVPAGPGGDAKGGAHRGASGGGGGGARVGAAQSDGDLLPRAGAARVPAPARAPAQPRARADAPGRAAAHRRRGGRGDLVRLRRGLAARGACRACSLRHLPVSST